MQKVLRSPAMRSRGSKWRASISLSCAHKRISSGQLPEILVEPRDAIVSAQHLVIVFPLWHGTMPAILKGFIEQVMRPGVALEYRKHGFPRGLLSGRSARLVVTMGMPALIYRWYFRAHGVRGLERSCIRG
jgi:putative NADPH-quinone reductase